MARRNPYGDGGLFKRSSDNMWVGSVEIASADGKRRQKRVYAKSRNECKRKRDELRAEIQMGIMPISGSTTVFAWLDYWLAEVKKPNVRPNTYDYYEESVRLHIKPHLENRRLRHLTPEHVRSMVNAANTPPNAMRAHKTLKLALKDAIAEGLIRANVAEVVDRPEYVKKSRGALSAAAAKDAMRAAITLEAAGTGPAALATYWSTAFLTGTRPGELVGLEWDRVDLDGGVIDLAWQLQEVDRAHGCGDPDKDGGYPCGKKRPSFCPQTRWDLPAKFEYRECRGSLLWTRPKSEAGTRIVPLVAPLIAMLEQHQSVVGPNAHNLVWHRPDGHPITRDNYTESWRLIREAAGLPKLVPYTSRHSTATLLQELGVAEETRMAIMGQSSAAAHRNYIHVSQDQSRLALGKLERLLALE